MPTWSSACVQRNGDMEGHCWVAVDGRALTEAPESFKELKYG